MTKEIDIRERYFWYRGNGEEKYGPHTERQMLGWYRESFLSSDVEIAEGDLCDGPGTYRPLEAYMKERGVANPFMPFDCLPKTEQPDTVSITRRIEQNMKEEVKKMRREMTDLLATGLANVSLCLAKDGEIMHTRIKEQIGEATAAWKEEIGKRELDENANFQVPTLNGSVGSGIVSIPSEFKAEMNARMNDIADLAISFKIDSEFALQKIDNLQFVVERLLHHLEISTQCIEVGVEDYESTLECLADFLGCIAARADKILNSGGAKDALATVVQDLMLFTKVLDELRDGIKKKKKEGERWISILQKVMHIYAELSALQERVLLALCTAAFPNEEKPLPKSPTKGREAVRERKCPSTVKNRTSAFETADQLPPRKSFRGNTAKSTSTRQHQPPHHSRRGGFAEDLI